ncbi:MAG: iron-containing redox enzyme family protein [Actinomycetota bacterium]|nr:iron-containing redox enzyme family protein [Actinomycetota bacterium]
MTERVTVELLPLWFLHCTRGHRESRLDSGRLYAFEAQVPAVAEAKIRGLEDHYGISDGRTLAFWRVHRSLDVRHAEGERATLAELAGREPEAVLSAAEEALEWAAWNGCRARPKLARCRRLRDGAPGAVSF